MVNMCTRLPAEQVFVSGCLQASLNNHPEYGPVTLREYGLTIVLEYGLVTLQEYGLVEGVLWTIGARYIELAQRGQNR